MNERSIFLAALEIADPARRAAYLDQACGADAALRQRAESLLKAYEQAGSFLDQPAMGPAQTGDYYPEAASTPTPLTESRAAPRFAPGTILAGRYRMVAILGKGGMGEVYRADDLKLGQPVALKFLPHNLAGDAERLARFHREVRMARQVSHPNVCRVYDIGEVDGQPFLTMEYIDGEDLAALLRRIGRLPEDKGIELARQLCLGLAAAHDKGVLHRDLKPANVMLDGRGQVRLTDFGLAGFVDAMARTDLGAGTPGYMAPEQLDGKGVTVQSDLYALGLVLYEMFTGKRAFPASSFAELARMQQESTPRRPSSLVSGINAAVDRLILHCLEKDPRDRPRSALAVAAGLPGGDPLAAALAAGATPSPEMVANATEEGSFHPLVSATLLAGILLGIFLVALLADQVKLFRRVPLHKSPELLRADARRILEKLDHREPSKDSNFKFFHAYAYVHYLRDRDSSAARWDALAGGQPAAMYFWYEESPSYLAPTSLNWPEVPGRVTPADPPPAAGMVSVSLDLKGRLIELHAVPEQREETDGPWPAFDWERLFVEAGLDLGRFQKTSSTWNPLVAYDQRAAWQGVYPEQPEIPLRVEAAAYHGRPVYFQMIGPWSKPERQATLYPVSGRSFFGYASFFSLVAAIGAIPLARRNLRLGRGDRKGAFRLGFFLFAMYFFLWVLAADHVPSLVAEMSMFWGGLANAVYHSVPMWVAYLALEPAVRRRWPWRLVSWTRLLAGRFRDPLIGRDILLGALLGIALTLAQALPVLAPTWLGLPPGEPLESGANALINPSAFLVSRLAGGVLMALIWFAMFFLLCLVLQRQWLALGALFLLMVGQYAPWQAEHPAITFAFTGLGTALVLFVVLRFGLLPLAVAFCFMALLLYAPVTVDLSAWYTRSSMALILLLAALPVYGFVISLAGRPLFRDRFFQEGS